MDINHIDKIENCCNEIIERKKKDLIKQFRRFNIDNANILWHISKLYGAINYIELLEDCLDIVYLELDINDYETLKDIYETTDDDMIHDIILEITDDILSQQIIREYIYYTEYNKN